MKMLVMSLIAMINAWMCFEFLEWNILHIIHWGHVTTIPVILFEYSLGLVIYLGVLGVLTAITLAHLFAGERALFSEIALFTIGAVPLLYITGTLLWLISVPMLCIAALSSDA